MSFSTGTKGGGEVQQTFATTKSAKESSSSFSSSMSSQGKNSGKWVLDPQIDLLRSNRIHVIITIQPFSSNRPYTTPATTNIWHVILLNAAPKIPIHLVLILFDVLLLVSTTSSTTIIYAATTGSRSSTSSEKGASATTSTSTNG